ncbi:MAG: hypothetical protein VR72_08065 [Clostridiaceae bacterium BRH_c20a]|nr:MAG: hypothetical protein VR72_08065 [Clostridiaceae bacterium BRH_c20a]
MRANKTLQYFLIIFILILITGCTQANQKKMPVANQGKLDLSLWDLEKDGIVNLAGTWEFYWKQLVNPEGFSDNNSLKPEFIKVPDAWNKYTMDSKLIGDGFATYRLLITTNQRNESLGLEIPKISTAYRLWVNNELLATNGVVGKRADKSIPQFRPNLVFFNSGQGNLELIIQISNFHHLHGGILENFNLGTENQIKVIENWHFAFDFFVFGSLFVVGIYHLIFYFYRRKERSNLYFGTFSTMIGLRALFVGKMFIFQLFPNLNWETALKVEYLTFYLGTPVFILYLKSILSREISIKVIQMAIVSAIIFSALVLLNPVKVYGQYNVIYQIYIIIIIIYLLYTLVLACLRKKEGAIAIGLAVVFFVSTIINDILYESSLIYFSESVATISVSSWGFLIFVFSQSIILSRKFTRAFSRIEEMTVSLQQLNESLEKKVLVRTIALENSNKKLEKANQDLSKMEKSRTDLLTNISHDLRSPMTSILGYVNAILDGLVEDPVQLERYLKRIRERINGLNHLTQDLFDLTQLESRKTNLDVQVMSVEMLMQNVYEKYLLDVQMAGINFKLISANKGPNSPNCLSVEVDIDLIDRAFANIIYNAIKHTPKGGTITLENYLNNMDNNEIIIKFTDNGLGIATEDLPHVFNRFFTGSKSRTSSEGSGLGLSITKEIVEYHNGRVWVTSKPGDKTTFYLSLPLRKA